MMSRQWVLLACITALVGLGCISPALAQTPGVLYTWDQSYGEAVGPSVEGWVASTSGAAIDNNTDGVLTITESAQASYSVYDSWNRIRETTNPRSYSGIDLTGLDTVDFVIGHNGTETYSGKLYVQTPTWHDIQIDVAPGAPQVFSFPLSSLSDFEIPWVQTVGFQVYDHSSSAEGPLTWTIEEVRSTGTPLMARYLSPHAPGDLDGVIVAGDVEAISGAVANTQNGLSMDVSDTDGGALRWVDLGGGPGASLNWADGRDGYLAKANYQTRPMDLTNYDFVDVRMKAQPGAGADPTIGMQFYVQTAGWNYQVAGDEYMPVDNEWHVMTFPLAGLANMDQEEVHGLNLYSHNGNMQMFVDYVRFYSVPEPTSLSMLMLGCVAFLGVCRKRG